MKEAFEKLMQNKKQRAVIVFFAIVATLISITLGNLIATAGFAFLYGVLWSYRMFKLPVDLPKASMFEMFKMWNK